MAKVDTQILLVCKGLNLDFKRGVSVVFMASPLGSSAQESSQR